ncbi:MAG: HAD-IA family hydrolase [Gammaproteobacteria bacterium]|nr:MAG: HAD-IA family hydrolase [Gammaproteobacteria bacterium]
MKQKYDLIVFDWDGTLMDSEQKIVRCFEAAAEDAGVPHPGTEAISGIIGLGMTEAVEALMPEADAGQREAVIDAYREHFLIHDKTEMPLFPGVKRGLSELKGMGYQLAVATGKARRGLDRVLEQWQMHDHFAATRCADEAGSKPHPGMLRDILEATQVSLERAIMVGDTSFDMEMAQKAGMDGLAVSYGVHGRERLLPYQPLACLDSFEEVCVWLS